MSKWLNDTTCNYERIRWLSDCMIWSRLESWSVEICVEIPVPPWSKFQSICWLVIAPSIAKVWLKDVIWPFRHGFALRIQALSMGWKTNHLLSQRKITGFTWRNIKTVRITRQDLTSEKRILRENWKNRTKYHDIFDRIYLHSTLPTFREIFVSSCRCQGSVTGQRRTLA